MEEMTLRVPVTIKARLTPDLKEKLTAEINEALKNVQTDLQQLEFQARRMIDEQAKVDVTALPQLNANIEAERIKMLNFKQDAEARMERLNQLEIGTEIVQGNLDRTLTVKIGDDLHKLMGAEILLEDGKITAFRM